MKAMSNLQKLETSTDAFIERNVQITQSLALKESFYSCYKLKLEVTVFSLQLLDFPCFIIEQIWGLQLKKILATGSAKFFRNI